MGFQLKHPPWARSLWRQLIVTALSACAVLSALRAQVDGGAKWPGPLSFGARAEVQSSPAVGPDGTIFIGVSYNTEPETGEIFAIDRNGTPKWTFKTPDAIDSPPTVAHGTLYVGCWDGRLYARDASTGARRWEFSTGFPSAYIVGSPAVGADGTIYIGSGDWLDAASGDSGLWAINPDGTRRWKKTLSDNVESSPAIGVDGTIYFGCHDGNVYALAPDSAEIWRFKTDNQIWGSPAIGADGTIYVGTLSGSVYAITPEGEQKWRYKNGDQPGALFGSPALGADGTIYIGSQDAHLYALSPDGQLKWKYLAGQPVFSTPAVRADGTIIFGRNSDRTQGGRIVALHSDGNVKWSVPTTHDVWSSPVVADGSIYVASLDGRLYALHSAASPLSSYSSWPMFHRSPDHRGKVEPPLNGGKLINISTLARAGAESNLIAGFVIQGTAEKHYLVRGAGPTLSGLSVANALPDPTLSLYTSDDVLRHFNNDWSDTISDPPVAETAARVGAFPFPVNSKDAAIVPLLAPGAYTAHIRSGDATSGIALAEVYDGRTGEPDTRLINLSARARVVGGDPVVPGLVVEGDGPMRLLIRAVGPGLRGFDVADVLPNPSMTIYGNSVAIDSNTGWTTEGMKGDLAGAAARVGAFPLAPESADSAALVTIDPRSHTQYTIRVTGGGAASTGEVLVEVYLAP